jgi:hypothetical protein
MTTNNKISSLISSQVPSFVRDDHPKFIAFLEAYYEYLEQEGKVVSGAKNIRELMDIDTTVDAFAEYLYSKFLHDFPRNTLTDKANILKNAKDIYRSKGTEKATRFLLRALFDHEIDFYYPKKDVLRSSDGKWYIKKTLRITNTRINNTPNTDISGLEKYIGTKIIGSQSNAQAVIETVDRFYDAGTTVDEIELSNLSGTFLNGENISAQFIQSGETLNITSEVFGATISSINIVNPGSGYIVGDPVIIESSTGNGASAIVGRVSTGNLASVVVIEGGSGFKNGDSLLVTGGGGSGATGNVASVLDDGSVHPNSYNILISFISSEENTIIANVENVTISSYSNTFVYSNTGPVRVLNIITSGNNYTSIPNIGVVGNTRIQELGILGRLRINSGGDGYSIGDTITFTNGPFSYGAGATANVLDVDANGTITSVGFTENDGYPVGGFGYSQSFLPKAEVVSGTGANANVQVTSLLGFGGTFAIANTTLGAIERIIVLDRGSGYTEIPTINLKTTGDGRANAAAILVQGTVTYPGRYLNDDGHLSSFNFLQDRDYYQNHSYVIRVEDSINKYRKAIKDLLHPAGMKLFGEFLRNDPEVHGVNSDAVESVAVIYKSGTYVSDYGNVSVNLIDHDQSLGNNVYLEFTSGNVTANTLDTANISNGLFIITNSNTDYFNITHFLSVANTSGDVMVGIIKGNS